MGFSESIEFVCLRSLVLGVYHRRARTATGEHIGHLLPNVAWVLGPMVENDDQDIVGREGLAVLDLTKT